MGTGVHKEKIQLDITVGGNQAKKQLGQLEEQSRDLTRRQKELRQEKSKLNKEVKEEKKRITEINREYRENNKALDVNKKKQMALRKEIGITGLTSRQLNTHIRQLTYMRDNLTEGTAAWKKYNAELQQALLRKERLRKGTTKLGMAIQKAATTVNHYAGMVMMVGFAAYKAYDIFIKGNAELSDQLSDVEKHTNLTRKELAALYLDLRKYDTRTAREELLKLASVAGKLGIEGRQNILEFVKASDKIVVSLGEDLGQATDDAVRKVGKIVNFFNVDKLYGVEKAMLKVGSAVNELGQDSTANEGYIVEWTNRVQGIAKTAKIALTEIMGLASANDQMAQSAEVSSTVFMQIIPNMFKDTATYARVANMETSDFAKLLKTDANEAFLKLLDGLNGNNDGLDIMVKKLDSLGLEGKRVIGSLTSLASNTNLIREAQNLANKAFAEGTSITNEFNKKNTNLAANLAKIGKWLKEISSNTRMEKWLTGITGKMAKWVQTPLADSVNKDRMEINKLVMQITGLNEGEEKRLVLLNELMTKYPQYYGEIDAATISNNKLRDSLKDVNKQMIRQAYLAKQKDKLADTQDKATKALENEIEYREKLDNLKASYFSKMGKEQQEIFSGDFDFLMQQFSKIQRGYDTAAEAAIATTKWLQEGNMGKQSQGGLDYGDMVALSISYADWRKAYGRKYKAEADAQKEYNRIKAFENKWGLNDGGTGTSMGAGANSGNTSSWNPLQKAIDLEALRIQAMADGIKKELDLEYNRHEKKLEAYKGNAKAIEYEEEIHRQNLLEIQNKYQKLAEKETTKETKQAIEFADAYLSEEEELTFDPAANAEIQKFIQTQEFKETFLEAQYKNGVISEMQYLEELDKLRRKYDKKERVRKEDTLQWGLSLAYMASDAINSLMQMELQAAGDNEEKKKEIRKKYADTQFAITAAQIIANTALSIMTALAQLGPIAGAIAAGVVGATGLIQLGVANKQRQVTKQMYKGGYVNVTGADDNRQYRAQILTDLSTGMLPANPVLTPSGILASERGEEYFVDNESLRSEIRDSMGLRIADHVAIIEALKGPKYPQKQAGGYSTQPDAESQVNRAYSTDPELKALLHENIKSSNRMTEAANRLYEEGVSVSLYGPRGLKEAQKRDQEQQVGSAM